MENLLLIIVMIIEFYSNGFISCHSLFQSNSTSALEYCVNETCFEEVPIPVKVEDGLSESKLVQFFGQPCNTQEIISENLKPLIVNMSVGPFTANGMRPFLELLKEVFEDVRIQRPNLYKQLLTNPNEDCDCVYECRLIPINNVWSQHAFGTAITIMPGGRLDPVGNGKTFRALLELSYFMHKRGIYWGAFFQRESSCYFGLSDSKFQEWKSSKVILPLNYFNQVLNYFNRSTSVRNYSLISFALLITGILTSVLICIKYCKFKRKLPLPRCMHVLTQIERKNIKLGRKLGEGNFGEVHFAVMTMPRKMSTVIIKAPKQNVALKCLKGQPLAEELELFCNEALSMRNLDHKNIVKLLGYCKPVGSIWIVLEMMEDGNLKDCLSKPDSKLYHGSPGRVLTYNCILRMFAEIAEGCSYLHSIKYIHRDLAARNILVSGSRSAKMTLKIADFGLSRGIYTTQYYTSNVFTGPVKWSSPESLQNAKFCDKSDIWSFGVLMWEIMNYGDEPFAGVSHQLAFCLLISQNAAPLLPNETRNFIKSLVNPCFNIIPHDRPSADEISAQCSEIMQNDKQVTPLSEYHRFRPFCPNYIVRKLPSLREMNEMNYWMSFEYNKEPTSGDEKGEHSALLTGRPCHYNMTGLANLL